MGIIFFGFGWHDDIFCKTNSLFYIFGSWPRNVAPKNRSLSPSQSQLRHSPSPVSFSIIIIYIDIFFSYKFGLRFVRERRKMYSVVEYVRSSVMILDLSLVFVLDLVLGSIATKLAYKLKLLNSLQGREVCVCVCGYEMDLSSGLWSSCLLSSCQLSSHCLCAWALLKCQLFHAY